jgi:hypothetical protein
MPYVAPIRIPKGSVEKARARVNNRVALSDAVDVELSPTPDGGAHNWLPAEWVGAVSTTREVQTVSAVTWSTEGDFHYHVRLDGGQIVECNNTVTVKEN